MNNTNENRNTVLVVDDEEMNIMLLNGFLKDNYDVKTASSGAEALEAAKNDPPDLILLDVMMPEMDGYEVLAELKKNDVTWKIPVIFITGLDSKEDEEKGLAMDAADYISKPLSMGIVKLRVKNQMQIVNQIRTIEALSLTDQLTGVPNRRNLDDHFEMEWKRAYRERQPLSFMMMDIDKFKVFNDTYGHLIGDEVLKMVAASFSTSLGRKTDFAARFGGEEFAIILPNTELMGARAIAERVRHAVEELVVPCGDGKTTKVTISIGVYSCVPSDGDEIPEMIAKADQALYTAKETGRNRVCLYGIDVDTLPETEQTPESTGEQTTDPTRHCGLDPQSPANTDGTSGHPPNAENPIDAVGAASCRPPENIISKLAAIDGINTESGLSHFSNMEKLYIETVEFFLTRLPVVTQDMSVALENGDIKGFSITVHSVKSMLSTVGALSLSRLAAKLETAGKSEDKQFIEENYPALHDKLKTMQEQLSQVFTTVGSEHSDSSESKHGASAAADVSGVPAPGSVPRKKIIHVDDVQYTLVSLKGRLREHFEIFSVSTHEQLFTLLEKVHPDMILLDVKMPGIDGYEIIRMLKANKRFCDIPVVFLTSLSDEESVQKCKDLGAADVIVKPVPDADLIKRIYEV